MECVISLNSRYPTTTPCCSLASVVRDDWDHNFSKLQIGLRRLWIMHFFFFIGPSWKLIIIEITSFVSFSESRSHCSSVIRDRLGWWWQANWSDEVVENEWLVHLKCYIFEPFKVSKMGDIDLKQRDVMLLAPGSVVSWMFYNLIYRELCALKSRCSCNQLHMFFFMSAYLWLIPVSYSRDSIGNIRNASPAFRHFFSFIKAKQLDSVREI